MYSNKPIDPESYSNASSTEGIIQKKSKWDQMQDSLGEFWTTKQILPKDADKTKVIKTTLRELLTYCAFLTIITYITFSMMNPTMYYQTKIMSDLFLERPDSTGVTFKTATQMDHFWNYLEGPLINGLYWDHWYNNGTYTHFHSILYENYLLGSPRIRQIRVRNDSCEIHKDFQRAIFNCYNHYSKMFEDHNNIHERNSSEFIWEEIKSFAKNDVWGKLSTYSGDGGYIVNLTLNRTKAIKKIEMLKKNLWIDRGTRAVFIDFTTYNPNINLYVVTKLIAEFPATGGLLTSWQFRTLNLLENSSDAPIALYLCFFLFILFILYYTIEELFEIRALGFVPYLRSSNWNFLDLFIILISGALVFFLMYRKYVITRIFNEANPNESHEYIDNVANRTVQSLQIETYQFDTLGFWSAQFSNVLAVLSFVSWIKIFKYISFNKTMSQLNSTLSRCAKDIAGFGVMFFIVFFAFAQLGYLLFGTQVRDYSSFGKSVFTLLRLILGDFDFQALEAANRVLGPIFFLSYIFFVFFVLMNMFLAIINDTYAEVKAELSDTDDFAMMDYFKGISNQIMNKLGAQKEQIEGIQQVIRDIGGSNGTGNGNRLSFATVRQELKKRNLSDQEIEMLFAKYDIDQNRELDEDELQAMFDDLEGKKKSIEKEIEEKKNKRPESALSIHRHMPGVDYGKIARRVDRMEYILSTISAKIDHVVGEKLAPTVINN